MMAVLAAGAGLGQEVAAEPETAASVFHQMASEFEDFRNGFSSPPADARPTIRYWLPGAHADAAAVRRDMKAIAAAGFGSVEIAFLPQNAGMVDPVRFGWGTPAWRDLLTATLQAAADERMRFSLTIGPVWPIVLPSITPDDPAAAKELVAGWQSVEGGAAFTGPLPNPRSSSADGVHARRLVAVQAWRCAADCGETDGIVLTPGTMRDLSGEARDGTLDWHAPNDGRWLLIAYWERGTGQISALSNVFGNPAPTSPQAYVPDHFSEGGAQAIADYWDAHILTPEIRVLIGKAGAAMFEDSLELDSRLNWTAALPDEFAARRGYRLEPVLPLVLVDVQKPLGGAATRTAAFRFPGDQTGALPVFADYQRTLGDLYADLHLATLKRWVNGIGLDYRVQPFGMPMDIGTAAQVPDIPEAENLTLNNEPDIFRIIATGGHISGNRVFGTECCSVMGGSYRQTLGDLLDTLHLHYAVGVNQVTLHGYPYTGAVDTARWPGWSPFEPMGPSVFSPATTNGFSEAWGPRQPSWANMAQFTTYLARTQLMLRYGDPQIDIAILDDSLDHDGPILTDPALQAAGYSYGFVSSRQLTLDSPMLVEGQLNIGKARFRALLVDTSKPVDDRLVASLGALAAAGGTIIGYGGDGLPGLAHAADLTAVVDLLIKDGKPPVFSSASGDLMVVHRRTQGGDYYWIVNRGKNAFSGEVVLAGHGHAARMNAWSGEVDGLPSRSDDHAARTSVTLDIGAGSAVIVVLSPEAPAWNAATSVTPAATLVLREWTLAVEDWQPAGTGLESTVQTRRMTLSDLKEWPEIQGLADVSGSASYVASFDIPTSADRDRTRLLLPPIRDAWTLSINGRTVPVDQRARQVDIGDFVIGGANEIKIQVATTLNNRLRVVEPDVYAGLSRQAYGITGSIGVQIFDRKK
jgi:hypothetical protein